MAQFSEKQRDEFKKGFSLYDFDGDGCITTKELGTLLRAMGQTPTNAEVQEMIKEAPADGSIDFELFLNFMSRKVQISGTAEELLNAFKVFDKEGTGKISTAELIYVMQHLGEGLSKEEAEQLGNELDPLKTGHIAYEEYVKIMMANPAPLNAA